MSQLDRILGYAFNHQTVIIEIIFASILAIVVVWLFSNLKQETSDDRGQDLNEIEAALKRVLEAASFKMPTASQAVDLIKDDDLSSPQLNTATSQAKPSVPTPGGPPPPMSVTTATSVDAVELTKLKTEVVDKSKKVEELEKALTQAKDELKKVQAAPAAGGGSVDTTDLQKKIGLLESRLKEYEIIEDDIANLSLYKEENTRLKIELEKVKGLPGEKPQSELSVVSTPVPTPAPITTPAAEVAPAATQPPAGPGGGKIDSDKLLQEFDSLLKTEKKEGEAPAAASAAPGEKAVNGDELIAEFENFMKGSGG